MRGIDPDRAGLVNTMREKQRKSQFRRSAAAVAQKITCCLLGNLPAARNFERMQQSACTSVLSCYLIDGAGHWVQQEKPAKVSELLIEFLQRQ
jgi:pimeloyl-ACP methyl ester carboxylesterase